MTVTIVCLSTDLLTCSKLFMRFRVPTYRVQARKAGKPGRGAEQTLHSHIIVESPGEMAWNAPPETRTE